MTRAIRGKDRIERPLCGSRTSVKGIAKAQGGRSLPHFLESRFHNMASLCDDDYVAYELAQSDRASLLQMAQRRGECVSDIAVEAASRAAEARLSYVSPASESGPISSREGLFQA